MDITDTHGAFQQEIRMPLNSMSSLRVTSLYLAGERMPLGIVRRRGMYRWIKNEDQGVRKGIVYVMASGEAIKLYDA